MQSLKTTFPCGRREFRCAAIRESRSAAALHDGGPPDAVAPGRRRVRGTAHARDDRTGERQEKSGRSRNHAVMGCRLQRSSPRLEAVDLEAKTNVDVEQMVGVGRPESRVPSLKGARYLQVFRIVRADGRGFEKGRRKRGVRRRQGLLRPAEHRRWKWRSTRLVVDASRSPR